MTITLKHVVFASILILALVAIVILSRFVYEWHIVRVHEKCNRNWALKEEFNGLHMRGTRTWKEFATYMQKVPSKWADKIHNNLYMQKIGVLGPDTVFMQYTQRAIDDLPHVLSGCQSYCAKISNLCESLGIFIVNDGVLMNNVLLPEDMRYDGPTKKRSGYNC